MKTKLTNAYTRLTFFKYGEPHVMEYNGNKVSAISTLKLMYSTAPTCIFEGTRDGYLPQGCYSTTKCTQPSVS